MPFEIVRNDITKMAVDAVVNTANPRPAVGSGTDAAIHAKAGPLLLASRKCIGDIATGQAVLTPGFHLPARYVIHTVGPVWQGGRNGEVEMLRRCYDNSLALALEQGFDSIAFPLIATGNYRFPKDLALKVACEAIREFLEQHEMQVYLVVFSRDSYQLSAALTENIRSYIDENYVNRQMAREYSFGVREDYTGLEKAMSLPSAQEDMAPAPSRRRIWPRTERLPAEKETCAPTEIRPAVSLEQMLKAQDAGFSETLLKYIDKTGRKDAEIYRRANISRQHFSKIRNNPGYKPTKSTALALAIALELDLEQTRDLIGRAGFALTNSSKADLIITYFIIRKHYNIIDINAALFEFDQSLLGA